MSPARELFDRRLQARSLAYLFGAGAVLPALALAFPHDAKVDELGVLVTAGCVLLGAVVFYLWADTVPRWGIHAGVLFGIGAITVLNHFSGFTAGFSLFYTWIALFAFYFMSRREALGYTALIGVAYAGLLAANHAPSVVVRWLLLVGTPLATGLLISRLLTSLKQEATSAELRADAIEQRDERTRMVLETAHDAYVEIDPRAHPGAGTPPPRHVSAGVATRRWGRSWRTCSTPPRIARPTTSGGDA